MQWRIKCPNKLTYYEPELTEMINEKMVSMYGIQKEGKVSPATDFCSAASKTFMEDYKYLS